MSFESVFPATNNTMSAAAGIIDVMDDHSAVPAKHLGYELPVVSVKRFN